MNDERGRGDDPFIFFLRKLFLLKRSLARLSLVRHVAVTESDAETLLPQSGCQVFSQYDGAMLAPGTSDRDIEIGLALAFVLGERELDQVDHPVREWLRQWV